MDERQELSTEALVGLCLAYLLSSVASATALTAETFTELPRTFSAITELAFIVSIGATPLIAVGIRRQSAWVALVTAHVLMIIGTATILFDAGTIPTQLSLSLVFVGQHMIAAALLVVAWRARSSVTAALAGVFVLPRVLDDAVLGELFVRNDLAGLTPLISVTLGLLFIGLLASEVVRTGESGGAAGDERSLDRSVITGSTLLLVGLATISLQVGLPSWGLFSTGPALLACLVGFLLIGVAHQNRATTTPAVHIDPALVIVCAAVVALTTWIGFGPQFLRPGSMNSLNSISIGFENRAGWGRAVSFLLVLSVMPIVSRTARLGRRSLSAGALAIAASGLVWTFFVLDDLEVGLIDFVLRSLLVEWGVAIVLGGAIAFALRRMDEASIEAGLIFFLAALPLVTVFAQQVPYKTIGADLISSGFEDTGDLRLFTLTTVIGLVWIAAWWVLRPDKRSPASESEQDDDTVRATTIDR